MSEKNIIDKGKVTISNKEDEDRVVKYIKAISEGVDTYKPEGLKFEDNSIKSDESPDVLNETLYRSNRNNINFVDRK